MAIEIERKFLVKNDTWRDQVESASRIAQGYLASEPRLTVRVRLRDDGRLPHHQGPHRGDGRSEFEYQIPTDGRQGHAPGSGLDATGREGPPPDPDRPPHLGAGCLRRAPMPG